MRVLIIAFCMLVSACQSRTYFGNAFDRYSCSKEQMIIVNEDAQFCIGSTDFSSTYCYGTAIVRNCKILEEYDK